MTAGKLAVAVATVGLLVAAHGHAPAPTAGAVTGCGGSNEALANCMAAAAPYGWTGPQAACLDQLWNHEESGFNAYAANSSSDARGIPQNIQGWSASYQPGNAAPADHLGPRLHPRPVWHTVRRMGF